MDLFFRFADQTEMLAALEPLGMTYLNQIGVMHLSQGSEQYAAWEVGEIPEYSGWHLNVRQIDPEFDLSSLTQYEVYPSKPVCVWA